MAIPTPYEDPERRAIISAYRRAAGLIATPGAKAVGASSKRSALHHSDTGLSGLKNCLTPGDGDRLRIGK